jgi:hypothetical protein
MRYYQSMETMNYGLKAPKLDDGSLLLQELTLTADQTAQVKADKESIETARNQATRAFFGFLLLDNVFFIVGLSILISGWMSETDNTAMSLFGVFCLVVSFFIGRHRRKGSARLALRMVDIFKESKIASEVVSVFKRYMPGDYSVQCYTYLDLMMKNDTDLGNNKSYRVRLDTSKDDSFVVREVILSEPVEAPLIS